MIRDININREGYMKLNKIALGLTAGILWGVGIFLATNFLLIAGGQGQTISKLNAFYFGYSFSFLGSLAGLIWGFVYGFITGWLFGLLYNFFSKEK
jgi:hypothetical protein